MPIRLHFPPSFPEPLQCPSSSIRSAPLRFYSRKPPGLVSQLRLLTAEAQSSQRRSAFLSINLRKPANCFKDRRPPFVRPPSRSVTLWFYSVNNIFFVFSATIINRRGTQHLPWPPSQKFDWICCRSIAKHIQATLYSILDVFQGLFDGSSL